MAGEIIYFFDEQWLKENTIIDDNVDSKYLRQSMRRAQEVSIQSVLGSVLYNDMQAELKTDISLQNNAPYKTLLDDYIQEAYKWLVLADLPTWLTFKYTNKSIVKKDSDNSTPVEREDLSFVSKTANETAQWYLKRLQEFLCANHVLYPKYGATNGLLDEIPAQGRIYRNAMYLNRPTKFSNIETYGEKDRPKI
jgi:hypothetical protein